MGNHGLFAVMLVDESGGKDELIEAVVPESSLVRGFTERLGEHQSATKDAQAKVLRSANDVVTCADVAPITADELIEAVAAETSLGPDITDKLGEHRSVTEDANAKVLGSANDVVTCADMAPITADLTSAAGQQKVLAS